MASLTAVEAYTYFDKDQPDKCHLIGDPDLYGIGVRLGFYFQYLALMIYLCIHHDAASSVRSGLSIFTLAVFTNMYRTINWEGSIVMPEILILCGMTLGLTVSTLPYWDLFFDIEKLELNFWWMVGTMSVWMLTLPWVFFTKLNHGLRPDCDVWVFFMFIPIKASNKIWQTFLKVSICLILPSVAVAAIYSPIVFYRSWKSSNFGLGNEGNRIERDLGIDYDAEYAAMRAAFMDLFKKTSTFFITFIRLLIAAGSIAQAEYTIKKNKIDVSSAPITSTGQFIPLLIGVYCVFIAIVSAVKKTLVRRRSAVARVVGEGVP
ncbi:hypothetical protein BZA77DRAFT_371591 [Pyronema omphalodes]|nr:hypothetical protein BZA77DRAFT_371591 [Pyronema omphalodes]